MVRDDAVRTLARRGTLTDHQIAAAKRFGHLYETVEAGGVRAIDPGRVVVDGGRINGGIGGGQLDAAKQLHECRVLLGQTCSDSSPVSAARGTHCAMPASAAINTAGLPRRGFELCLDHLAASWKYSRR